jgi:hypothetical protein
VDGVVTQNLMIALLTPMVEMIDDSLFRVCDNPIIDTVPGPRQENV